MKIDKVTFGAAAIILIVASVYFKRWMHSVDAGIFMYFLFIGILTVVSACGTWGK